jgi:hypothetical protein
MDERKEVESSELEDSLLKSLRLGDLAKILVDAVEVTLDAAFQDGLFRDIPVVSIIVGLGKTSLVIRDRIFLKKLLRFLRTAAEVPANERDAFTSKLDEDPTFRKRVGETLIVIIDRLDDLDKASILAKVFNAYVQGKLDFSTFTRLVAAIDRAHIADTQSLLAYYSEIQTGLSGDDSLWERLYSAGLSNLDVNVTVDHDFMNVLRARSFHPLQYSPNDHALALAKAVLGDKILPEFAQN